MRELDIPDLNSKSGFCPESYGNRQHRYVHVGSHGKRRQYLCLGQNPLALVWLLYRNGKPFGFRGRGVRRVFVDFKAIIRIILVYLHRSFFVRQANEQVDIRAGGHFSISVRNGYKVFDFRKRVVVKLFSANVDQEIVGSEIAWMRRLGEYGLAPRIRNSNIDDKSYEEEYVNSYPTVASNLIEFSNTVQKSLIPIMNRLIVETIQPPAGMLDYALEWRDRILSAQSKSLDKNLEENHVAAIGRFVDLIIGRLRSADNTPIYLACSHGDFAPKHLFESKGGPVLIDWEMVGYRSILFDLFHGFFRRLGQGKSNVSSLTIEMEMAISLLLSRLSQRPLNENSPCIVPSEQIEVYRLIYYIECIGLFSEQGNWVNETSIRKILRFIAAYNDYEDQS